MDRLSGWSHQVAGQVREAIDASDLSVRDVAEVTGIPRTTLRRSLQGLRPFDIAELERIADALGVHLLEFFCTATSRAS